MKTGKIRIEAADAANVSVAAVLTLGAALFFSRPVAVGVAAGTLLMCLNFFLLRYLLGSILAGKQMLTAGLFLVFKFFALLGVVYLVYTYVPMNGLAFALAAAFMVLAASFLAGVMQKKEKEA